MALAETEISLAPSTQLDSRTLLEEGGAGSVKAKDDNAGNIVSACSIKAWEGE